MVEIIIIGIAVNFFGNGLFALFAPYASFVLHGNAAAYGFLGAAVAVGSLIGATTIGRLDTRLGRPAATSSEAGSPSGRSPSPWG